MTDRELFRSNRPESSRGTAQCVDDVMTLIDGSEAVRTDSWTAETKRYYRMIVRSSNAGAQPEFSWLL